MSLLLFQCVWTENIHQEFTGAVDVDGWWRVIEENIVEASVFFAAQPMQIEAHTIAPWIPPACRAPTVVNTEFLKGIIHS